MKMIFKDIIKGIKDKVKIIVDKMKIFSEEKIGKRFEKRYKEDYSFWKRESCTTF